MDDRDDWDDRDDEEPRAAERDRDAILRRRRRFVSVALAGLASTTMSYACGPDVCLRVGVVRDSGTAPAGRDAGDRPTDAGRDAGSIFIRDAAPSEDAAMSDAAADDAAAGDAATDASSTDAATADGSTGDAG